MTAVIDKIGPVIVYLSADEINKYNSSGYIINSTSCSQSINHNALAVGYGTDQVSGMDYYIVKNSWGNTWG